MKYAVRLGAVVVSAFVTLVSVEKSAAQSIPDVTVVHATYTYYWNGWYDYDPGTIAAYGDFRVQSGSIYNTTFRLLPEVNPGDPNGGWIEATSLSIQFWFRMGGIDRYYFTMSGPIKEDNSASGWQATARATIQIPDGNGGWVNTSATDQVTDDGTNGW